MDGLVVWNKMWNAEPPPARRHAVFQCSRVKSPLLGIQESKIHHQGSALGNLPRKSRVPDIAPWPPHWYGQGQLSSTPFVAKPGHHDWSPFPTPEVYPGEPTHISKDSFFQPCLAGMWHWLSKEDTLYHVGPCPHSGIALSEQSMELHQSWSVSKELKVGVGTPWLVQTPAYPILRISTGATVLNAGVGLFPKRFSTTACNFASTVVREFFIFSALF